MPKIQLYHGSPVKVDSPSLALCRPSNDYGRAFYCTEDIDLAKEWACPLIAQDGVLNEYALDATGLTILDLDAAPDGVLTWIAVLLRNRRVDREWNVSADTQRFIERYDIDLSPYDIVRGYRADDSYFSIARAFVNGALTDRQLSCALQLGDLGYQMALRTERALAQLEFIGCQAVDATMYGPKRNKRDRDARCSYNAMMAEASQADGKRFFELIGN